MALWLKSVLLTCLYCKKHQDDCDVWWLRSSALRRCRGNCGTRNIGLKSFGTFEKQSLDSNEDWIEFSSLKKTNTGCYDQRCSFQLIFEFRPAQRKKFFVTPSRPLPVKHVRFVDHSRGLGKVWRQRVSELNESLTGVTEVACAYGQVETLTTGNPQLKFKEPESNKSNNIVLLMENTNKISLRIDKRWIQRVDCRELSQRWRCN